MTKMSSESIVILVFSVLISQYVVFSAPVDVRQKTDAELVDDFVKSFHPFFDIRTADVGIRKRIPFKNLAGTSIPFTATRLFWTLVPSLWAQGSGLRVGSNQFDGEAYLFHKDDLDLNNVEIEENKRFPVFHILTSESHEGFVTFYQTNIYSRIIEGAVIYKTKKRCLGSHGTFSNYIKAAIPEFTAYFKEFESKVNGKADEGVLLLKMLIDESEEATSRACAIFMATDAITPQNKQAIRDIAARDSTSPLVRCAAFASLHVFGDTEDLLFMEGLSTNRPLLSFGVMP